MRRSAVFLLLVFVAGCSSATHERSVSAPVPASSTTVMAPTPTTPATVDYPRLGRAYLAALAPVTQAIQAFKAKVAQLPATATGPDVARVAAPLVAALRQEETDLLAIPVPAAVAPDLHAVVTADGAVIGDLEGFAVANSSNTSALESQLVADFNKGDAAVRVVEADLHLPPLTS